MTQDEASRSRNQLVGTATKIGLVVLAVCLLDFSTKYVAVRLGVPIEYNRGVSFGLFPELAGWWPLSSLFVLIATGYWGWHIWKQQVVFLGLLLGGGVANVIDRLVVGAVRDWIPMPIVGVQNNVADLSIFVALVWFVSRLFSEKNKSTCESKGAT